MSKRKGLALLAVAAGAVTAIVMGRRRRHRKQGAEPQTPEETTAEEVGAETSDEEGAPQIP